MRLYLKITCLSLLTLIIAGCKKDPKGSKTVDVYVSGIANGKATYWKNGVATQLGDGNSIDGKIVVSNGDVYVSGGVETGQGPSAFYYKNGTRIDLGAGETYAVAVNGTDVYLAGMVLTPNGYSEAAYWKNGQLINLGVGGDIYAITIVGNDIYMAGETTNDMGGNLTATYWKNGVATTLGFGTATSIAVAGNDVYVSGFNSDANGMADGYWKNGTFVPIENALDGTIYDIKVSGNNVYLAGYITKGAGMYATLWKNGVATSYDEYTIAYGLAVNGTDTYMAGSDIQKPPGNVQFAYSWKNGAPSVLSNTGLNYGKSVFVVSH
ncbi:hypothetical protein [Mucilaginibacter sp. L196]|uniref:hypothetical protein n=1 Tax=Mucilaginibacter sp. L196 TaxID=1641870 RepID=UPI00131C2F0C|nr:hypothetical protein [Mucilaginibacter sp. L196]